MFLIRCAAQFIMLMVLSRLAVGEDRQPSSESPDAHNSTDYDGDEEAITAFLQSSSNILSNELVNECGSRLLDAYLSECEFYNMISQQVDDQNRVIHELFGDFDDNPSLRIRRGRSRRGRPASHLDMHEACCVSVCTRLDLMRHCVTVEAAQSYHAYRAAQLARS